MALSVQIEFSEDNSNSSWHDTVTPHDRFIRWRLDTGVWSNGVPLYATEIDRDMRMFRAVPLIYDALFDILQETFLITSQNETGLFRTVERGLDFQLGSNLPVDKFPWAVLEFGATGRVNEEQAPYVYIYPLQLSMVLMTFADKGDQEFLVRNPYYKVGVDLNKINTGMINPDSPIDTEGHNTNPGIMDLYTTVAGFFWGYKTTKQFAQLGIPRTDQIDYGINNWTFDRAAAPDVPGIAAMMEVDVRFRGVQIDFIFDVRERNEFR